MTTKNGRCGLEATGLSRSTAIQTSLLAPAELMRRRHEVAREAAALDADDADRAEMLAVASMMESMRERGQYKQSSTTETWMGWSACMNLMLGSSV